MDKEEKGKYKELGREEGEEGMGAAESCCVPLEDDNNNRNDDDEEVHGLIRRRLSTDGSGVRASCSFGDDEIMDDDDDYYFSTGGRSSSSSSSARCLRWAGGSILILAALAILIPRQRGPTRSSPASLARRNGVIPYSCPATDAPDNFDEQFVSAYSNTSANFSQHIREFEASFRDSDYDDWGKTYGEVKQGMYDWKSKHYPPYVESGMKVYESACGVGMNLYMTLEILHEIKQVENIQVYGNDFVEASVQVADALFTDIPPFGATKGRFCQGDSTHLENVPSDSFDLVFTGYVSPLFDPLGFGEGLDENYEYYSALCKDSRWKGKKLNEIQQQRQEDWFARWAGEMIRIAKPGAPVILEQIAVPYCDYHWDWGGVVREWWGTAIDKYGWDVDPDSLDMQDDVIFKKRYHVFMKKKKT